MPAPAIRDITLRRNSYGVYGAIALAMYGIDGAAADLTDGVVTFEVFTASGVKFRQTTSPNGGLSLSQGAGQPTVVTWTPSRDDIAKVIGLGASYRFRVDYTRNGVGSGTALLRGKLIAGDD